VREGELQQLGTIEGDGVVLTELAEDARFLLARRAGGVVRFRLAAWPREQPLQPAPQREAAALRFGRLGAARPSSAATAPPAS